MIPQFLHKRPELSIYSLELHSVTQLKPFELTNKSSCHIILIINNFNLNYNIILI